MGFTTTSTAWPKWAQATIPLERMEWIEIPSKVVTVYVAGPYTNGNTDSHVKAAIAAADWLFDLGYIPFVPHLSHFWHERYPRSYNHWMQWCYVWLSKCDVVLRLPGKSEGADDEVALAHEFEIPVYYSVEELWEATRVR